MGPHESVLRENRKFPPSKVYRYTIPLMSISNGSGLIEMWVGLACGCLQLETARTVSTP